MWKSFAEIGRGNSEMWLSKEKKKEKNITGKTYARPERWFRAA